MSSRFVARAAFRHSSSLGGAAASPVRRGIVFATTPSASHAARSASSHGYYHSYALPSQSSTTSSGTAPRNTDVPETSISLPDQPLPRVQETRPPSSAPSSPPPPPPLQKQQQSAAAPQQQQQQPQQQQQEKAAAAPRKENEAQAQKPKPRQRPKLRPRKAAMTLTPTAVEQLRQLLDQPEPKLIKVGVRNRGCSGLAYHLEFVEKAGPFDEAVEQDGVKVLIDSKALFSIIGSEMDWAEDKLNQRFVFRNPNIKEECGCGESFMV